MDWAKAIEINQAALARIVAALFAIVGLAEGGVLERPPRAIYLTVLRILRPAESAVRRLIIIVARGLEIEASPSRLMPKGLAFSGQQTGSRKSFQLFDQRKRFIFSPPAKRLARVGPRIWLGGSDPLAPPFLVHPAPEPQPVVKRASESDGGTQSLGRRLTAIKLALEDMPRQARRLLRWQNRRQQMKNPKFTSPLRPGPPPGHRKEPSEDVDFVLKECHWLAWDSLVANTS